MREIYTIGHSTFPLEKFLQRLSQNNVDCIVDVRSNPYSKFAPQYNSPELKKYLNNAGLHYIFMGKEFGARQTAKELYTPVGYLDFEKFSKTDLFKSGVERIYNGLEKGFKISLMCTEKDPIDCHRNILVAREFYKQDFIIKNILANGKIELQNDLEKRLLNMYFPNREQKSIFDLINGEQSETDLINRAYRLRNCDIGYRFNKDEEGV